MPFPAQAPAAKELASRMTFNLFVQSTLIGINLAAIYALMALGLTLMFGILGIVNLAHGAIYMLGAYALYYLYGRLGMSFFLALVFTVAGIGLLGLLMERALYRPVEGHFAPVIAITLALMIFLETGGNLIFGHDPKGVVAPVAGVSRVLDLPLSNYRLPTILISALLVAGLYVLIHKTRIGIEMRAVEEDRVAATLQGVNVHRINAIVFSLACGLAAAAGVVTGPLYSILPTMGNLPLSKAFMVIILGGTGSIPGAICGRGHRGTGGQPARRDRGR